MVYRNIVIPHTHETDTRLRIALLNTELGFWKTEAANLKELLVAIPAGIKAGGSVTIHNAAGEMVVIQQSESEESES